VAAEYGFFVRDSEAQPEVGAAQFPAGPPAVAGIVPRSRADAAGLKTGDVLVAIDGRPVDTVGAAREALKTVAPDGPLSLVVERDRQRVSISLDRAKAL
jgi:regulator of sigma E protease